MENYVPTSGEEAFVLYEENYVIDEIEKGLKNTKYENDIDLFDRIFNNVFNQYEELLFEGKNPNYDDIIKNELLNLGIA